jgi:predicted TIM-barrel fold metal-dependent hydrolase
VRGIFDAHLHIIDPAFPLVPNQGYLPDSYTVAEYLNRVRGLGVTGGAVVSGSFQGFDQDYLVAALARLGPGFVGVTQLAASTSDREIRRLAALGVRGLRFNLRRGGSESVAHMREMAHRVFDLAGWHLELYADASLLGELEATLLALPAVSIDHLGLSRTGLPVLLRLVEGGVRVKACGFGRLDYPAAEALGAIHGVSPHALMFGSDLPSTRAPRPFLDSDVELIVDTLGPEAAGRVLRDNAIAFYRIPA